MFTSRAYPNLMHTLPHSGSGVPLLSYTFLGSSSGSPYTPGSDAEAWRKTGVAELQGDIAAMKKSGMAVWSSSDIFVLPMSIYDALKSKITEGSRDGKHIAMNKFTLSVLLPGMIDELFLLFPDVAGIMVGSASPGALPSSDDSSVHLEYDSSLLVVVWSVSLRLSTSSTDKEHESTRAKRCTTPPPRTHTHSLSRSLTPHALTHSRTHVHVHTHTRTHLHHTHSHVHVHTRAGACRRELRRTRRTCQVVWPGRG
jgi:hypothetical protein